METDLSSIDSEWGNIVSTSLYSAPIKHSGSEHLSIGIIEGAGAEIWTFDWERPVPYAHMENLIRRVYPHESKRTQYQMDKMLKRIDENRRRTSGLAQ
jgi:hypothetical protein